MVNKSKSSELADAQEALDELDLLNQKMLSALEKAEKACDAKGGKYCEAYSVSRKVLAGLSGRERSPDSDTKPQLAEASEVAEGDGEES